jgi:hypothetical protein
MIENDRVGTAGVIGAAVTFRNNFLPRKMWGLTPLGERIKPSGLARQGLGLQLLA